MDFVNIFFSVYTIGDLVHDCVLHHVLMLLHFTEPAPEFTGELTVAGAVWQDELADTNSQQFQQLAQSVQAEVGLSFCPGHAVV